jgi:hypothetical protein
MGYIQKTQMLQKPVPADQVYLLLTMDFNARFLLTFSLVFLNKNLRDA